MFGTLRKHKTWLWGVIITLTIISFVWYFNPAERRSGGGRSARQSYGVIDGQDISREQALAARNDVAIIVRLNTGNWPGRNGRITDAEVQRETQIRLWLNKKLDDLGIEVSSATAAEWIANAGMFRDRETGSFQKQAYDEFVKRTLREGGLAEHDFEQFVKRELGRQQLAALYGAPGKFVTSAEAEALYREENEQFVTELVTFNTDDFRDKVNASATNLAAHFTNNLGNYRLRDRVVAQYVRFDFTNHLATADENMARRTNLTQLIDSFYQQQIATRGPNFYMGTNNQPLPPEAAKVKIRQQMREEIAQAEARKAAVVFADQLESAKAAATNFSAVAAKNGLKVAETKPFSEFEPPAGLDVDTKFSRQAFALTDKEPFAGPVVGDDAAFVFTVTKRLPSEVPPMESVLQKVMDDFRQAESFKLARAAGAAFAEKVRAGLAAKKDFTAICAGAKVQPIAVPSFSLATRSLPEVEGAASLFDLRNVAPPLKAGTASDFAPTRAGGFVLFMSARKPADETKLKAELPAFLAELRQERQGLAFQEWMGKNLRLAPNPSE
ncbi:MAG: SurA N-terminal domain-containing protein [Verrucomicrobia bacterium]|nr:SurA N-terminal domain-containing protein [Verrucomicrobiota bacterium]